MALDVTNINEFMSRGADLNSKMMQNRLNQLYAEPERQAQLNMLQAQAAAMPETLQTQNAFRQASAQNLMNPFRINQMLSSSGKHVLEPQLLNALASGQVNVPQLNQLMQQQGQGGQQGMQLPVNQQQLQDYYAAQRQKSASDTATRNRVKFATNIEKTLNNIGDPSFFNEFTGLAGKANLMKEKASALSGKPVSESFKKWNNFVNVQVPILSGQIRQFYGDSIQPSVREELQKMENPDYWYANPELAYGQFNTLIDLLRSEAQTYNESLNAPTKTSEESMREPLPPKSTLGDKKTAKTYSDMIGKDTVKSLINSGKLTKDYFAKLPKEQQDAIIREMKAGGV